VAATDRRERRLPSECRDHQTLRIAPVRMTNDTFVNRDGQAITARAAAAGRAMPQARRLPGGHCHVLSTKSEVTHVYRELLSFLGRVLDDPYRECVDRLYLDRDRGSDRRVPSR